MPSIVYILTYINKTKKVLLRNDGAHLSSEASAGAVEQPAGCAYAAYACFITRARQRARQAQYYMVEVLVLLEAPTVPRGDDRTWRHDLLLIAVSQRR